MGPLANRSLKRTKDEDDGPEPSSKRPKKADDLTDTDMKALYLKNQLNKVGQIESMCFHCSFPNLVNSSP
jgi:hypothetical protein